MKTVLRCEQLRPWQQGHRALQLGFTVLACKRWSCKDFAAKHRFHGGQSSIQVVHLAKSYGPTMCILQWVRTFARRLVGLHPATCWGCCQQYHWFERPQHSASQDDPIFMAEITLSTAIKYLFLLIKFWSFSLIKYGFGRLLFQVPAFAFLLRLRF